MTKGCVTGVCRAGSTFFFPLFLKVSAELRGAMWEWGNGGGEKTWEKFSLHASEIFTMVLVIYGN